MIFKKIFFPVFLIATILSCISETPDSNDNTPGLTELSDEAKLAAIWISDEAVYPLDLAWELQGKFTELREKYGGQFPDVNHEFIYPAAPRELLIGFDSMTMQAVIAGEYDQWNELNQQYGLDEIIIRNVTFGWVKLVFKDQINPYYLSGLYDKFEGVRYASPNYYGGQFSNVYPWIIDGQIVFLVRLGYGDCASGCINNHFWYFKSDNIGIYLTGEFFRGEYGIGDPIPSWWHEIEPVFCKFNYGMETNCGVFDDSE